jgi:hypothetical protein
MRTELSVLLMEDENGGVSVQLFSSDAFLKPAFDNLKGKLSDKPSRATRLDLKYNNEQVKIVGFECKVLPVIEDLDKMPDGVILGEGPVKLKKPDPEIV